MGVSSKTFYLYWRVTGGQPALNNAAMTLIGPDGNPLTGYTIDNWVSGGAYTAPPNQQEFGRCKWTFPAAVVLDHINIAWPDPNNIPVYMVGADEEYWNPNTGRIDNRVINVATGTLLESGGYVVLAPPTFTAEANRDNNDPQQINVNWVYSGNAIGFALVESNSMTTLATVDGQQRSHTIQYTRFAPLYLRLYLTDANGNLGDYVYITIPESPPPAIETPSNLAVSRTTNGYRVSWSPIALVSTLTAYDSFDYAVKATRVSDGYFQTTYAGKLTTIDIINELNPADDWEFKINALVHSGGYDYESPWSSAVLVLGLKQDVADVTINADLTQIDWTYIYPNTASQNTQIPVEIQMQVDNSGYQTVCLFTDTSVYPTFNLSRELLHDLFRDRYSDGSTHTVSLRAKTVNTMEVKGGEWLSLPQQQLVVPGSPYQPKVVWVTNQITVSGVGTIQMDVPRIQWDRPQSITYQIQIDNDSPINAGIWSGNVSSTVVTDWLNGVPEDKRDGQPHTIRFVFNDVATVPTTAIIPNRSSIMPAAPSNFLLTFKKLRNAFTNIQSGCEFTARLTYVDNATTKLKAEVSIDYGQFTAITWSALSAYPPTIKLEGINVPQDGLSHVISVKVYHQDVQTAEKSAEVLSDLVLATFDLAPPPVPTSVTATLIRPGTSSVTDQVKVTWVSDDPVNIVVIDPTGKKRNLYTALDSESEVVLENTRRFGPQDGLPHPYRFGVSAFNRSNTSDVVYVNEALSIVSGSTEAAPQTPDEIAGTAVTISQPAFIAGLATATNVDPGIVQTVLIAAIHKIKDTIAKGGNVTLDNLGRFAAVWTPEKTVYRNGQYSIIPAQRNGQFLESIGFTKGTRAGLVLSDTEAANM